MTRSAWGEVGIDARRFAAAMVKLGMKKGDRIATLAMNHGHHLVSWYGTAGMGGVLHTVNPRLFDEQLVYIVNHAGGRSEEHTSELQSLMRISYAVFCLKKKIANTIK